MTTIQTADLAQSTALSPNDNLQVYCGLDAAVTWEVNQTLHSTYQTNIIYDFERALQAPYIDIMQRGFLVDSLARGKAVINLYNRMTQLTEQLNLLAGAIQGHPVNPNSRDQLIKLFYTKMRIPEKWTSQKGIKKLSMNRDTLEWIGDHYFHARPLVSHVLKIRELSKQVQVFEEGLDSDGRFRTSYNLAGTETGRPSSSTSAWGTGGNAQNIAPGLRHIFVADHGFKIAVIDLAQTEARDVGFICGNLFGDWSYLDNCESGDLHTNNARLIWPELGWKGEPRLDRAVANQNFYRDFSYRDMAKRGSHLTNYYGTSWTMAKHLKIPDSVASEFQARYCKGDAKHNISPAFPVIARWWDWTARQLQLTQKLITPFGRTRHFFGRPSDDTTLREAIAFMPQSMTADRMNLGLWRVWKHMPQCQLLAQTYDSITFQCLDDSSFDRNIAEALERIKVELIANNGRKYAVPGEAKTGYNWGYWSEKNPGGLMDWKPGQDRRERAVGLQRVMA